MLPAYFGWSAGPISITFIFRHIPKTQITTFVAGYYPKCKSLPKNGHIGASERAPAGSVAEDPISAWAVS